MKDIKDQLLEHHPEYLINEEELSYAENAIHDMERKYAATAIPNDAGNSIQQKDVRRIAEGFTTRYIREGGISFVGERISGPDELVALMQPYRNPLYETTRVFYLKDSYLVCVENFSNQLPGITAFPFDDKRETVEHVQQVADSYGADSIYLLHNHPTGDPSPSFTDLMFTVAFTKLDKFSGHIIINHARYAMIENNLSSYTAQIPEFADKDLFTTASLDHPVLNKRIRSGADIAALGKQLESTEDTSCLFFLSRKLEIRKVLEVSNTIFSKENIEEWLQAELYVSGAQRAIMTTQNASLYEQCDTLIKEHYLEDVICFDPEYPFYWSRNESGIKGDESYLFAGTQEKDIEYHYLRQDTEKDAGEWQTLFEHARLFVDMDGTLAVFTPVDEMETLYQKGYFLNLQPHENVVEGLRQFMKENPKAEVFILSSVLSDSPYARDEKNLWLDRYLPEIDTAHRLYVPCGQEKARYVPGSICNTDILLDDYSQNLHQWPGTGLKLMNAINGTRGTWQKDKIAYDLAPEQFAKELKNEMKEILLRPPAHAKSLKTPVISR